MPQSSHNISLTNSSSPAMHRRISTFMKPQASASTLANDEEDEKGEKASTVQQELAAPAPKLKVKRVDYYYSRWARDWKYRVSNTENL
jgi:hypothetical protein